MRRYVHVVPHDYISITTVLTDCASTVVFFLSQCTATATAKIQSQDTYIHFSCTRVLWLANTCTCTGGTAAVGTDGSCETDGAEDCTACDAGYWLNGQYCVGTFMWFLELMTIYRLLLYPGSVS